MKIACIRTSSFCSLDDHWSPMVTTCGHRNRSARYISMAQWSSVYTIRDLTDKPNRIESESGKESKGDIDISVVVIRNICYGDW